MLETGARPGWRGPDRDDPYGGFGYTSPLDVDRAVRPGVDPRERPARPWRLRRVVPPETGRYRVHATGNHAVFGLAVRDACLERHTERACAQDFARTATLDGSGGHGFSTALGFEATAGEVTTVVVVGVEHFVIEVVAE